MKTGNLTDAEMRSRVVDSWDGESLVCLCCAAPMRIHVVNGQKSVQCTACDYVVYFDAIEAGSVDCTPYPRLYPSHMEDNRPMQLECYQWKLIQHASHENARVVLGDIDIAERNRRVIEAINTVNGWIAHLPPMPPSFVQRITRALGLR